MRRYHPPEVSEAMQELARAQESLLAAAKAAWQEFLSDFAALYEPFKAAVSAPSVGHLLFCASARSYLMTLPASRATSSGRCHRCKQAVPGPSAALPRL